MSETKRDRKGTEIARPSPDDVVPTEASTDPAGLDVMAPQGSRSPDEGFLIAGVGASAGGLDAFSKLVAALPVDAPLALVLVQHLAPEHESALPGLLSARTTLPVVAVEDGTRVESGHVYVMPPNVQIELRGGRLHLLPRPEDRTLHRPVDVFFRSLAAAAGSLAVGVVLSGTGSDGADGMLEIKGVGGVTIAQSPESAAYDGMPGAAIRTGRVDIILPPADIAGELARIARHPMLRAPLASAKAPEVPFHERELARVFALLRAHSGVDFHAYKLPTIARRIMRRMVLHKLDALGAYLRLLESSPAEVKSLYDDVLINVTRFFREPQSFEALASLVFPKIVADHRGDRPVRIWIAACSTGEEGYSVAMALLDYLAEHALHIDLQIFATDLSEGAIEHARLGTYPESIAADVSPERLAHYFAKVEGGYRIHRSVRDLCVFARQDLTSDPPFSKLDLILCRNVLIYMSAALQKKLIHIFHYALKPNGFLMLGQAETIGAGIDLFAVAEKRHRIYAKRASTQAARMNLPLGAPIPPTPPAARKSMTLGPHDGRTLQQETDLVMLDRFAPPGVVVDADMQIVQFRGQTGVYLQPAPGDPTLNLMKMAREGLLYGVRTAVHEARKVGKVAHSDGHRLLQDGTERVVNIEVVPMRVGDRPYLLVLFEDASPPKAEQLPRITRKRPTSRESRIAAELEHELAASRAHLQSIIQELEAANEELQSANEEVLSSNEELQSMNEELDTAKEELQSTNEELNTVNDELHGRNEELSRVNSDLVNLLASVQIAIVIVASDLKIRRFTPMAERALNLIAGDVGRPIGHIKPNIDCPDLETLIHEAIDTRSSREREVRDRQGKWCSLRVRPYKNEDGHVDGAVLSLFDIDDVKRHEATMRQARDFAEAIVETVRQPLCVLDGDLRVRSLNKAFASTFGITEADARGAHFYEIGGARWDAAELRRSLSGIVPTGDRLEGFAVEHRDASGRARAMLLDARRIAGDDERAGLILLAFDDAPGGRGEG